MRNNGRAGIPADAQDHSEIDPSENVKALSEAANKRQDDLRLATDGLFEAKLTGVKDLMLARHECAEALAAAEARRIDEQAALRDSYSERLVTAEAKRIDAIRAIDVTAVATASQRQSDQAQVLATQLVSSAEQLRTSAAASAEALRVLVANNAETIAVAQQQFATQVSDRITKLEQAQFENKGQSAFRDPALNTLQDEVRRLTELSKTTAGTSMGTAASWTTFVSIIGMATGIVAVVLTLIAFMSRNGTPATTQTPQVIYLPAPAGAVVPAAPPPAPPPAPPR